MKQARKALRALKGVIRLQAIIRGQAVRRQLSRSLKNVPSNAKVQKENQDRSTHTEEENYKNGQIKQFSKEKKKLEENEPKVNLFKLTYLNLSSPIYNGQTV